MQQAIVAETAEYIMNSKLPVSTFLENVGKNRRSTWIVIPNSRTWVSAFKIVLRRKTSWWNKKKN